MSNKQQPTVLKYHGFELLCKPNTIDLYRAGKLGRDRTLIIDEVFKNSKKGDKPSSEELEKEFGTKDLTSIIDMMLTRGEYQLSAEERKKKQDEKRAEIKNFIFTNYTDENGAPIPMTRIELFLEEMKARIDGDTHTDQLLKPILKKLPELMRVKQRKGIQGVFKIKHQYLARCKTVIATNAVVLSERYVAQGAIIEVNLMPHQQDILLKTLDNYTNGDYKFDVIGNI